MDALGTIMAHIQQPFTWPNLPDSAVAAAIFGKYAMIPSIDSRRRRLRTILDTTTNQRDYDAAYLFQLASRNNYELYIQPDPVIGLDVGHFHPPLTHMPPQGVLSIDFGKQTNLSSFTVSNDMLGPTSASWARPSIRARARRFRRSRRFRPSCRWGWSRRSIASSRRRSRVPPPPTPPTRRRHRPQALRARQRIEPRHHGATARSTASSSRGRCWPACRSWCAAPGRQNSGLYYVQSVTHRISRDDYTQSFSAWRNAVGLTGAEVFIDPLAAVA